jgi:hypothetical protein
VLEQLSGQTPVYSELRRQSTSQFLPSLTTPPRQGPLHRPHVRHSS